ncbi:YraN family protein [Paenibacillus radicis (ex Gao et al. 2016)]|uniref:UPF0102 protein GCM10010918_42680 n=1 Tax=Paenibacillus radicis (ex Gao et al. 2016) TaxID=1737354 RepID=A0A917M6R2_9BACL|nr:YraN family protein [Paenibacillus radicis (ex Gao et al. 2016)]GGG80943.1 UPF0102 protein [Paenibacillus radicis (ex Gao et al. 2016)]
MSNGTDKNAAGQKADGRKLTGEIGEAAAFRYLSETGFAVIERNWRCRIGELDLIASRDGLLIIVEVRTRRAGGRFGTAAESVDRRKQQKLAVLAQFYMRQHIITDQSVRFDVIAVTLGRDNAVLELKHIEAAF